MERVRAHSAGGVQADDYDIVIVGAGISGVGAAYHLQDQCPAVRFLVLEALESFGGTWLTHKYPGIRSDSDLYTFGYRFKPWTSAPIASAAEILKYMGEVIEENGLAERIRYRHRIVSAKWSSETSQWTLLVSRLEFGDTITVSTNFLWMCQGYYRHQEGYIPEWPGVDRFQGRLVHPQNWPEDLDYAGKKVVVIGSGATAATLAPAIAGDCAHLTVLQRSPTYFIPGRNQNELADTLRELKVDERWIHEIVRRKIVYDQDLFTRRSIQEPEAVRAELLAGVAAYLPQEEVAKNFNPTYRPWRQRIAFVPDGDIFQGIAAGRVSVVTDEIDSFCKEGIQLKSGAVLEADIIISATGFNMNVLGDIDFSIDDVPLDFSNTVTYRGMMFTGVPNLVWVFGYFRASWTLRADLVSDFVCRLLNHMHTTHVRRVEVALRPEDADMPLKDWIDPENFNPGYLMRAMHLLPKRGDKPEWQHTQDYWSERDVFPTIDIALPPFTYA